MEVKNEDQIIGVIVKISSYTESQKRAIKKYQQNNKDKVNQIQKKYYDAHKNDPIFIEANRRRAKEYYERKKIKKLTEEIKHKEIEKPIEIEKTIE